MLISAIADLLPTALAIALSPIPVIAVILVLRTPRARINGPAFALGWIGGLVVVAAAVLALADDAADPASDTAVVVDWLRIIAGLALWRLAVKSWKNRPGPGDTPELPGWMSRIAAIGPARALRLGLTLSAANPKNFVFIASGAASIAQADLGRMDTVIAAGVFVALASISVVGSVGAYLLDARRATAPLAAIERAMTANSAVIMSVLLVLIGTKILGDGIAGLAG